MADRGNHADRTGDAIKPTREEQRQRVSEARFQAVWEAMSEAIAVSDPDGIVLAANPAYLTLYGYDEAEVVGHSFAIIFPAEQRESAAAQYREVFAVPHLPQGYETRIQRKDGTERDVEAHADFVVEDGRRVAMISVIRDVTDRVAAETALRASEQRLRLALDAAGMGVFAWDLATDRTDADPRLREMLDLAAGEAFSLATALTRHLAPNARARAMHAVERMLDPGGNGRLAEEVPWIDAHGRERWLAFTGQALFDGEGDSRRAVRAIGGVVDVTARKRAETEREAFATSAAHDLRTPLTAITGQAQLLLRRIRRGHVDAEAMEMNVAAIGAAARRMMAMVDDLMDAARLDAGQALELRPGPVDLVAVAETVTEEAQATTTRHVVRVAPVGTSLIGTWDGARLVRLLGNLLGNAIKYSPRGGEVTVHVRREQDDGGTWAVLGVTDQGVGIPAGDLPHVLVGFRRGRNVEGRIRGTGLGLAGAARIVEQHGGTMQVTSTEGEGTTVTIRLPLDD